MTPLIQHIMSLIKFIQIWVKHLMFLEDNQRQSKGLVNLRLCANKIIVSFETNYIR